MVMPFGLAEKPVKDRRSEICHVLRGDRICLLDAKGVANAHHVFESLTGDATSSQMLDELVGDNDFKFKL
jgi:hypothetical protein